MEKVLTGGAWVLYYTTWQSGVHRLSPMRDSPAPRKTTAIAPGFTNPRRRRRQRHPFFRFIDWEALVAEDLEAPIQPRLDAKTAGVDLSYFDVGWLAIHSKEQEPFPVPHGQQLHFEGFDFNKADRKTTISWNPDPPEVFEVELWEDQGVEWQNFWGSYFTTEAEEAENRRWRGDVWSDQDEEDEEEEWYNYYRNSGLGRSSAKRKTSEVGGTKGTIFDVPGVFPRQKVIVCPSDTGGLPKVLSKIAEQEGTDQAETPCKKAASQAETPCKKAASQAAACPVAKAVATPTMSSHPSAQSQQCGAKATGYSPRPCGFAKAAKPDVAEPTEPLRKSRSLLGRCKKPVLT